MVKNSNIIASFCWRFGDQLIRVNGMLVPALITPQGLSKLVYELCDSISPCAISWYDLLTLNHKVVNDCMLCPYLSWYTTKDFAGCPAFISLLFRSDMFDEYAVQVPARHGVSLSPLPPDHGLDPLLLNSADDTWNGRGESGLTASGSSVARLLPDPLAFDDDKRGSRKTDSCMAILILYPASILSVCVASCFLQLMNIISSKQETTWLQFFL